MRKDGVDELLTTVEAMLNKAKAENKCSRPDAKSMFEHLRSSLEYIAHDINEALPNPKRKIYFPYGKDEQSFNESIVRNMPGVIQFLPNVYAVISDLQPHKCNDYWLVIMCDLTNEAKHNNPIKTREDTKRSYSISTPGIKLNGFGGPNLTMKNVTSYGKKVNDVLINDGDLTITENGDIFANVSIEENNIIMIDGHPYSLFDFILKCLNKIRAFAEDYYKAVSPK